MRRYRERVPDVAQIVAVMTREGLIRDAEEIENDHIAFRTLGVPHLGIASLEKVFLHYGYTRMDKYFFPEKKLDAYWYAPPVPELPRIFISELRVQDLSPMAQGIIRKYTGAIIQDPVDALDLDDVVIVDQFLHSSLWATPHYEEFTTLLQESEYAAWVIYNRYYLNHFTISVHNLKAGYDTIEDFNAFLEKNGFILNNAGGKIKESADGLLLQSSTVSRPVDAVFADSDTHQIAGSYVEFAERRPLPAFAHLDKKTLQREQRREGFEAANADKIFESTYSSQTTRVV